MHARIGIPYIFGGRLLVTSSDNPYVPIEDSIAVAAPRPMIHKAEYLEVEVFFNGFVWAYYAAPVVRVDIAQ